MTRKRKKKSEKEVKEQEQKQGRCIAKKTKTARKWPQKITVNNFPAKSQRGTWISNKPEHNTKKKTLKSCILLRAYNPKPRDQCQITITKPISINIRFRFECKRIGTNHSRFLREVERKREDECAWILGGTTIFICIFSIILFNRLVRTRALLLLISVILWELWK